MTTLLTHDRFPSTLDTHDIKRTLPKGFSYRRLQRILHVLSDLTPNVLEKSCLLLCVSPPACVLVFRSHLRRAFFARVCGLVHRAQLVFAMEDYSILVHNPVTLAL